MKNRVTVTVRQADERSSVLCLLSRSFLFFQKVCFKKFFCKEGRQKDISYSFIVKEKIFLNTTEGVVFIWLSISAKKKVV